MQEFPYVLILKEIIFVRTYLKGDCLSYYWILVLILNSLRTIPSPPAGNFHGVMLNYLVVYLFMVSVSEIPE